MPRFPIDEIGKMTKEEKFTSVAVYIAKTVDHLKGIDDEPKSTPFKRPNHDRSTGSTLSSNLQSEDLLHDLTAAVTSLAAGEKRQGKTVGPDEVARKADPEN